ncbi:MULTISPECIES: hypothetical protein [unclassified Pseudomonas]|uniref:hypothetical protein n=1 Tax=unclassified Pseudomonas TaxID=196821 RepID=UPI0030DBEEC1
MIAEDFELVTAIFQLVEAGIVHGYDAFRYRVEWGGNYMEVDLAVEKNSSEIWDAETDFNHSKIYALVEKLHEHAVARGEALEGICSLLSRRRTSENEIRLLIPIVFSLFSLKQNRKIAAFGSAYTYPL